MIDETFVKAIANLQAAGVSVEEFHGIPYVNQSFHPILPPTVQTLKAGTLDAVRDYLLENPDALSLTDVLIHIISPTEVAVKSTIDATYGTRTSHLTVSPDLPGFKFGSYYDQQAMMIALFTTFVQDGDDLAYLKGLVGNLVAEESVQQEDDGTTQRVTAKAGLAKQELVSVKPIIRLKPYRTFTEVIQPESAFLVRLQKCEVGGVKVALHEADAGAWRVQAIQRVAEWLNEHVIEPLQKTSDVTIPVLR